MRQNLTRDSVSKTKTPDSWKLERREEDKVVQVGELRQFCSASFVI